LKFKDYEFTAEYIQTFLERLKNKVEDRIFNFEKIDELLPKLGNNVAKFNHLFEIMKEFGKDLTTEFSTKFRKIWNGTLVEIGMDVKSES
jgi:uncharacterized protein YllA (UPF0747 family)